MKSLRFYWKTQNKTNNSNKEDQNFNHVFKPDRKPEKAL